MMQIVDTFLFSWVQRITGLPDAMTEKTQEPGRTGLAALFFFLLLIVSAVYARAIFFPVLGIDTFTYALSQGHGDIYFEIVRGTWGFAALNQLVPGPLVSPLVSMLFFLVTTTFAVFLVAVFWTGTTPDWKAYMTCAVMALFPYWASQAYFGFYHYGYSLAMLAGVLSVVLPWHKGGWARCVAGAACVVLGASMYQGSFTIASGLVGASLLVGAVNAWLGRPQACFSLRSLGRVGLTLLAGGGFYLLAHKAVLAITHMPDLTMGYTVHFDFSLSRLLQAVHLVIPGNRLLLPQPGAWFLAVPVFVLCLTVLCANPKKLFPNAPASRRMLLWLVPLSVLALLSPLSLSLIQSANLTSRSTSSVAFVWGAVFLLAALLGHKRWKTTLILTTVLLCLFFAGRINYAWQLQTLTTEADMSDARLMNQRLYDLPEFSSAPKPLDIAFVGCISADARSWEQDFEAIFGLSQFFCAGDGNWQAHPGAVLRFVGGHIKTVPVGTRDLQAVSQRKPWPAAESVFWNGDHAVIWLGPKTRKQVTMQERLQRISSAMLGTVYSEIKGDSNAADAARGGTIAEHPLLERVRQGPGPWSGNDLRSLLGALDNISPLPENTRYVRIVGWAFDLAAKQIPQYVALRDCNGAVVGLAATGQRREDLLSKVAVDAEFAGFEGFALAGVEICSMAY